MLKHGPAGFEILPAQLQLANSMGRLAGVEATVDPATTLLLAAFIQRKAAERDMLVYAG